MKRRNFIKTSLAGAGGLTVLNFPLKGANSPSNRVRIAVMGVNSRGAYHAEAFTKIPGVEVAYLCDVEEKALANGIAVFKDSVKKPLIEKDIRRLVEKKDFEALIIATPDHWHAPASLMALQNRKHVYVEKPAGHNPRETEILIEAVKKYDRLVEVGSQRRSFPSLIEAAKLVHDGIIGKTYYARSWYANDRKSIGKGKITEVPAGLDFELWQGPAPRRPYKDNIVHYNWHWFWNWGTAETCNNGNHEIDCCRWFLDVGFPSKVNSTGGRFAFDDDWEVPDTQVISFEFGNKASISWEGRSCQPFESEGSSRGFVIYGDKGSLVNKGGGDYEIFDLNGNSIKKVTSDTAPDPTNILSASGDADMYHLNNFIQSVRGEAQLTAPIDDAHKSVVLCHLANISQRTGSTLHCNTENGHILNNPQAESLWGREYEKGWEMKL